jgi:hypothetical protein
MGLSAAELDKVRAGLAGGRRPKVMFTAAAGQIAGQLGQVVALTDPAASDEWVVVRFGRDELPFSPGDLQVPPRGRPARPAPPPAPARPAPEPEFLIDKPVRPSARRAPRAAVNGHAGEVPASAPRASSPGRSASSPSVSSAASPSGPSTEPADVPAPAPRRPPPAARRPKAKPAPALTVTLAYAEGEWTVAAAQGSRTLARPYVVKPAEAMRMVAMVDVPGVQEAVEQIVSAERAEAEQQAERLRAQLAEVESRLAELRDVRP